MQVHIVNSNSQRGSQIRQGISKFSSGVTINGHHPNNVVFECK